MTQLDQQIATPVITRLRLARTARGWTLGYVSKITGIDKATISRIENLRVIPYPGHRRKLAKLTGVPEEQLQDAVFPEEEVEQ